MIPRAQIYFMSSNHSSPRILVTGATGMLGLHYLMHGIEKGLIMRGLFRSRHSLEKAKRLLHLYDNDDYFEQIEWVKGDVTDILSLEEALKDVDVVIHAAALVSFAGHARQALLDINFQGTANMVNAALDAGIKYFLHISSVAALDGQGKIDEKAIWTPSAPHTYYGISKHLAEMEVWRGMEEGLPAGIINPSIIIGPPATVTKRWTNGFGRTLSDLERGRIPFYTEGTTGYVDVNDVVEIGFRMLEQRVTNERFVVSAENKSFREILELLAHELGRKPPQRRIGRNLLVGFARAANTLAAITFRPKPYDLEAVEALFSNTFYDNTKVRKRFHYEFIPIEQSIRTLVRHYRKSQD